MIIGENGLLIGGPYIRSPNFDARPDGIEVELLVVHGISLPPDQFGGDEVVRLFTNTLDCTAHPYFERLRNACVSAHFYIRRNGRVLQFVPCTRRAWHAGVSNWRGRERCNDFSIGIELEGADHLPYADAQYTSLARLSSALRRRYSLIDIVGHSDIAPGRKTDPGDAFDWDRFRTLLSALS